MGSRDRSGANFLDSSLRAACHCTAGRAAELDHPLKRLYRLFTASKRIQRLSPLVPCLIEEILRGTKVQRNLEQIQRFLRVPRGTELPPALETARSHPPTRIRHTVLISRFVGKCAEKRQRRFA